MSDARQIAHELIDRLPDEQIPVLLDHLRSITNPAAEALRTDLLDDEEADQEAEAVDEARRWTEGHGGKGIPHAEAPLSEPKTPMATPSHQGEVGGPCPLCGSETVARQSRTTGELYFGCTNFSAGCRFNGSRSH